MLYRALMQNPQVANAALAFDIVALKSMDILLEICRNICRNIYRLYAEILKSLSVSSF